jgi:membrane-associated phospholipid phosphatase
MEPVSTRDAMRIVMITVGLCLLSMAPILMMSDMSIDVMSLRYPFIILSVTAPLLLYAVWRRMVIIPETLILFSVIFVLSIPIIVWTYAAMRVGMPLADARLVAMDAALGFDWRGFIDFVDAHPRLAKFLEFAYTSFYLQLLILPFALTVFGYTQRACALIVAYVALCVISSIVCIWFPALGTYVVYGVGIDELSSIFPKFGFHFLDQFHAVREAGSFTIILDQSAGIVTFPSVHAGVAALCAWASWSLRWVRYPMLVLNIAMAMAAVTHANHYLIDVIAGIGIAAACVSLATPLFYRRPVPAVATTIEVASRAAA